MTYQSLPNTSKKKSHIWLLNLPYEKTVCGKTGTSKAPKAILDASMDIEYFEEQMAWNPFKHMRIFTDKQTSRIKDFKALEKKIKNFLKDYDGQFVLSLGGEHSVTPYITKHLLKKPSTIIFFDAHGDFRKSYLGSKNSHACALHNVSQQGHKAIAIGLRSFFDDEQKRMKKRGIRCFSDFALQKKSTQKKLFKLLKNIKGDVYISLDVDCFNPSLISGTGTPLPGGLDWFLFLKILLKIYQNKQAHILGADIVELIPEKSKVSQIVAAKIAQKMFSFWGVKHGFKAKSKKGSQMMVDFQ